MPEQNSLLFDDFVMDAPKTLKPKNKKHIVDSLVAMETISLFPDYQFDEEITKLKNSTPEELLNEDLSFSEFLDEEMEEIEDEELFSTLGAIGLSDFLINIGQYKVLSREEEHELFQEYNESHSETIRNKIICHNVKLVVAVAKRIIKTNKKMEIDDMINEGVIGLIRAIEKFDYTRGYKFSTYAFQWIRQAINRGIANTCDTIRIPVHYTDNLSRIRRQEEQYMMETGKDTVPIAYITEKTKLTEDKVKKYKQVAQVVGSLDNKSNDTNLDRMGLFEDNTCIRPEESTIQNNIHEKLMKIIDELTDIEKIIIVNKFNLKNFNKPLSVAQLSDELHISRTKIKEIEDDVLAKLKTPEMFELLKAI